jgi:hypothetical protein
MAGLDQLLRQALSNAGADRQEVSERKGPHMSAKNTFSPEWFQDNE